MDRKKFLTSTALFAFSVSVFGKVSVQNDSFKGDCETTNDILGPFYRPDAPHQQDLTHQELKGQRVTLKGIVFGKDCVTPLKNALVEIWHANTKGEYDNDSQKFHQRAQWLTNEKGEYSFTTILPGKYKNGKLYRPAHIHYRVSEESSQELISQIYFQGDPHIEKDPWASDKKAVHRILPIVMEDICGGLVVNFDVYLASH
jgi:protocatechuate 3,4-dioxygenase beta subunit